MKQQRRGWNLSALAPLGLLVLLAACALGPRDTGRVLVQDDARIFDPRFRDLEPDELDLSDFWTEANDGPRGEGIPIHHRTYANIVASVGDSIVNLYTKVLREREMRIGIDPGDLLPIRIPIVSEVLDFIPFQLPIPYSAEGFSLGSGFIINHEGYILTNAHVVRNATDIRVVRTGDRQEYEARIIGIDTATDTALIRIDPPPGMTVLTLGRSENLEVGEIVIAVGNPLGLNHTVSSGLISAKERLVPAGNQVLLDYLQTDSAINPGSSGGPLLNLYGEVVGINTAIVSDAQNIGFAIPIDTVKRVMPLLVSGRTERGWFGASARPLAPGEAQKLGHPNPNAVIVDRVIAESPASKAGLRPDDLILRVGDHPVTDFVAFRRQLIGLLPGQTLDLTLLREGVQIEVTSTLADPPAGNR